MSEISNTLENQLISRFIFSENFARKVLPFSKPEFFENPSQRIVVEEVLNFFGKYNKLATKEILEINVVARKDLSTEQAREIPDYVRNIREWDVNEDWLLTEAEKFYQRRAVYLAIVESIKIIDNVDNKGRSEDGIPALLSEALSLSFDSNIGHNYFENSDERFDFYHTAETGIPFDIEFLNNITGGVGLRKKTLTAIAAKSGGGKSVGLCHIASSSLQQGKNVLYITLEMSDVRIAERIDANMMRIDMHELRKLDRRTFDHRLERIRSKINGQLIIKEYPTGAAHAGHFRALIEELKQKRAFKPDLVIVDYLGICLSQRVRNAQANSYTVLGSVAEELRALAQEYNIPVLSAVQINRGGIDNTDIDMTDTSDSMKIVHALDFYFCLIRTDELDELGQVLVKVLKNRYGVTNSKFIMGVDFAKSLWYNTEDSAQCPVMQQSAQKTKNSDLPSDSDKPSLLPVSKRSKYNFSELKV